MRGCQILYLLCFLFFLQSSLSFASALCPPDQRDALLHFRNSSFDEMSASCISITGHIPRPNRWNLSVDCCSWYGVTCDDVTGNIMSLDLTCNWLSSTIYSNSSLHLPKLEFLRLRGGNLTKFPYFLHSLNRLVELDLSSNIISGEIPRWFWGISHDTLKSLDLSKNLLEGSIPQLHWKRLSAIHLEYNAFHGPLPIPPLSTYDFDASNNGFTGKVSSMICQLSSLQYLDLSSNNLNGTMPPCFCNITTLQTVDLSSNFFQGPLLIPPPFASEFRAFNNGFTGEIPYALCQLSSVQYLDLSFNNLSGNMPPCFGNMTSLLDLDLSTNNLQGQLPRSLTKCANLSTLRLSYNMFSDIFPHWLKVQRLDHLDLRSNQFYGRINSTTFELSFSSLTYLFISNNHFIGRWPTEVFLNTSLNVIDLSNNKFGGSIPLPSPITYYYSIASNKITGMISSSICNATELMIMDLSRNSLTGSLPLCLTNFSTFLSILDLRMNHLQGTIPQSFPLINSLATLDLSLNWFEGTLPRSLVQCKDLEVLDLGDNQMEDTFPSWLGTLPKLKILILRSNNFKGFLNIPKGAKLFSQLRILDLSNNYFGGPLPVSLIMNLEAMMNSENGQDRSLYMDRPSMGSSYENSVTVTMKGQKIELIKILTFLTIIDLSHNYFQGKIPGIIGHLHSLIGLNLSHNQFIGSIPPTLGNLTNVEWLDLSSNKLSGGIPRELGDLAFLGYLDLSKNQLTGRIPQDKHLSTFSSDWFSWNPGLCGTPLPKTCPGDARPPSPPSSSIFDHKGHENWFKQKTIWIGYASGIIIGISIAYIALEMGRPKWLVRGVRMLERQAANWMKKPMRKAIKFHGQ